MAEFALVRAEVAAGSSVTLPGAGPRIVLCVRGTAQVCTADQSARRLDSGDSVFVAASEPAVEVSGDAVLFQAAPNLAGSSAL